METLIKSTTDTIKEMMSLIKNEQKAPKNQPNNEKKKKQEERHKAYNEASSVKIVGRSILPKQKMSVGSWRKRKTPAHPIGSHQKAPEGVQGP
jgi:hypothetical protein